MRRRVANDFIGGHQKVDVEANPGCGVAATRLRQGDTFQRSHRDPGFAEQAHQPGQFFRQQLVADCIGQVKALQFSPDLLGGGRGIRDRAGCDRATGRPGECRLARESRAPARNREPFEDAAACLGRELSAVNRKQSWSSFVKASFFEEESVKAGRGEAKRKSGGGPHARFPGRAELPASGFVHPGIR